MKCEFYLEGLGCANCAAKMEKRINELEEVNFATVDFVNKKLIIDVEEKNYREVAKKAEDIVKSIESHVNMIEFKDNIDEEEGLNKIDLIKYLFGVVFFILMFFTKNITVKIFVALISYILIGGDILLNAFKNIAKGQIFDENFLMTIATFGAFLIGEYPEAISVMLFYKVGETLQDMAVDKSRRSIKSLINIKSDYANLVLKDDIKQINSKDIKVGDVILVKPGERVAVDGIVIEGTSSLDTSALTGEAMPRFIQVGDEVLSGVVNLDGVIKIKATKTYRNSTVQRILELVENASQNKAKTEKFITKFARYYTPIVVFLAFVIATLPVLLGYGNFNMWIYRALIFLVVSCPCALVISIPLSFFSGIGAASKRGILIKGSNYIEALYNAKVVVFDKTGTLTEGKFKVSNVMAKDGFDSQDVLKYAAYCEVFSNHPIAKSILNEYKNEIDKAKILDYKEISGYGVLANVEGKGVLVGNDKLMKNYKIEIPISNSIGTVVYVAVDGDYIGHIEISDTIKLKSKELIEKLKSYEIDSAILTGDNKNTANDVAKKLGIEKVYAELLPQDKVEVFNEIKKNTKGSVVFVGDGINDSPVLRLSDVGIAMGGLGQDAAIEASDIVITNDDVYKVYEAIKISQFTRKIVIQNIILALSIKILVLILAAFGLSNMWEAVFADVGVALMAVINSRRIIK